MKIISGEYIQDLCKVSISKKEQKEFESLKQLDSIDIDSYDFTNYDNPSTVYVNSSLINISKPELIKSSLFEKLKQFKNPFDLILHNSDDPFDNVHLKYFDIPNIKRIFSQNVNTTHDRLIPLPIGLANEMWEFGDKDTFKKLIQPEVKKTKFIHFNFTVKGGARDEFRPQCYNAAVKKGIEKAPTLGFVDYINELKQYKYCLSPEGNGIDCHRMWECFYLKVIPICHRNVLTEYFANLFPIVLVDDWNDLDLEYLEKYYDKLNNWKNYYLLDLDLYLKHINFNDKS